MITHIWQSTLFAGAAGLLTLLLRRNRARTRYWVWFIGLVKFLVPFGLLVNFGSHVTMPQWTPKAPALAQALARPAISFVMGDVAQPALTARPAARGNTTVPVPAILLGIWACGFVAIATCWVRRWMRIRADVRLASKLQIDIGILVVSSPALCEPGVFGIFHSVLVLPDGMSEHLSKAEWEAILAHEMCHVRCHDNLTAVIYMVVESIFWFHPLVWWMGTRLVAERERACDEEVLRLGSEPEIYAEGILKVCELYVESPLQCVAGVTGSNLRERIRSIMTHRGTIRMSITKKLLLAAAGMSAVTFPIVVGGLHAQPAASSFDVASIRPCEIQGPIQDRNGHSSPGRLDLGCDVLDDDNAFLGLIRRAYVEFADGRSHDAPDLIAITGGPKWIHTQGYKIEATADGHPSEAIMAGPMLQRLLEDRFRLKIHRETREAPVYALALARDASKLKPFQEGSCVVPPDTPYPWTALPAGKRYCMENISLLKPSVEADGASMEEFVRLLDHIVDRPVLDETGVSGRFDIHLTFARDQDTPKISGFLPMPPARGAAPDPVDPTIFTAVQEQLGLKLVPTRRPVEILVIDSVERPSGN
ncbi:MAG TPA: M56 family metallopeptidase [Bryobacteraceae bacterium]|nr:M56 family metallopeptidase [Bryobacteraceae bacterium]